MSGKGFDGGVSMMTAQRKQKEEQTQIAVGKTFSLWASHKLSSKGIKVNDIFQDFKDGTALIYLFEILSGKRLEETLNQKYHQKPDKEIQKIENVSLALQFLQKTMNINPNINPKDVVDGNPKIVLAMIWRVVITEMIPPEDSSVETTASQRNKQAKSNLLGWVKMQLEGYSNVNPPTDFETSFSDGKIFSSLIHKFNPNLIDLNQLSSDPVVCLENAFNIAEKHLGIPKMVDASVMATTPVDEKIVMTYLAEYPLVWIKREETRTRVSDIPEPVSLPAELRAPLPLADLSAEEERLIREEFMRKNPLPALQPRVQHSNSSKAAASVRPVVSPSSSGPSELELQIQNEMRSLSEMMKKSAEENARRKNENDQIYGEIQRRQAQNAMELERQQQQAQSVQQQESNRIYYEMTQLQAAIQALQLENYKMQQELLRRKGDLLGTIKITVTCAKGLKQKAVYGGSEIGIDAFATIRLDKQLFKTKTEKKTFDPYWDETFTLYVSNTLKSKLIEVTVWDDHLVTKPGFRGQTAIGLETIQKGQTLTHTYTLLGDKEKNANKVYGTVTLTLKREECKQSLWNSHSHS
eukprot:TRINITY_DN5939_c0_g1_i1.p1 TRINITY_DN5939_c0_g1~~TRINITY_DN5939_c0_g1_i1.p1  ORF type:complete len:581 (+),score=236.35 TRINITY_DN5939_c0_g1_i1:252-1994(+)